MCLDEMCSSKYDGLCEKKNESELKDDDDEMTQTEENDADDEDVADIDEAVGEEAEEAEIGEHVDVPQKTPRRNIKSYQSEDVSSATDDRNVLLSCDFESESEDCKIRFEN